MQCVVQAHKMVFDAIKANSMKKAAYLEPSEASLLIVLHEYITVPAGKNEFIFA